MFSKKEENRPITSEKVNSILGDGTEFTGKIKSSGIIRIEGKFEGELESSQDVIIAEKAEVHADIRARNAVIAGDYHGNVDLTGKLEIKSSGKVFGNIKVSGFVIEDGGVFDGQCNMVSNDSKARNKNKEEKHI